MALAADGLSSQSRHLILSHGQQGARLIRFTLFSLKCVSLSFDLTLLGLDDIYLMFKDIVLWNRTDSVSVNSKIIN